MKDKKLKVMILFERELLQEGLKSILQREKSIVVIDAKNEYIYQAIMTWFPHILLIDQAILKSNQLEITKIVTHFPALKLFIHSVRQREVETLVNELNIKNAYFLGNLSSNDLVCTIKKLDSNSHANKIKVNVPYSQADMVNESRDTYMICCFQYFHIKKNGKIMENINWRTQKVKELFIYLLQHRNQLVRKDRLIELFWSKLVVKNAYANLYIAVYHMRKTLKSIGLNIVIINSTHYYELRLHDVQYDVEKWLVSLENIKVVTDEMLPYVENAIALYKGDYLADEPYKWSEQKKERLKAMFISTAILLIEFLITQRSYAVAITYCVKLQRLYPEVKDSNCLLMKIYDKLGKKENVEYQYNKLQQMIH
ncbi:BTAD domain-containing putative transcriptional regulator [Pseudogracilibacillus auburnensis]|uniref:Transcriptional activator n=1 Tax=Pseudogracilibacillus auburnensis TaxID=1494959 RepID=A0A2V3VNF5_9BACI|nr:BTAD domain-containing putative transcriptional regulator [Pseudogracilibacillus auburnensis]MBO1001872.1 hypothetical protein [Pseudogracilibacillus auburnensis]PXW83342.1 transcriptional activator [Pseudogracilibacillus auburnensis]